VVLVGPVHAGVVDGERGRRHLRGAEVLGRAARERDAVDVLGEPLLDPVEVTVVKDEALGVALVRREDDETPAGARVGARGHGSVGVAPGVGARFARGRPGVASVTERRVDARVARRAGIVDGRAERRVVVVADASDQVERGEGEQRERQTGQKSFHKVLGRRE
jgi:hypothetical protein